MEAEAAWVSVVEACIPAEAVEACVSEAACIPAEAEEACDVSVEAEAA